MHNTGRSEELRTIISNFRPNYQDFNDQIAYSKPYYQLLLAMQEQTALRDADQQRILDILIQEYQMRGIQLEEQTQKQLKNLNQKIAQLSEQIQNNVVDDQKDFLFHTNDEASFAQLPKEILNQAKKKSGSQGGLSFDADPNTLLAILKYCENPEIRKTIYQQREQRASQGRYNNKPLIFSYLQTRAQQAKLRAYPNYASYLLQQRMAKSPAIAKEMLEDIFSKAKPKAEQELQSLQDYYQLEKLNPRDIPYYSRKYKEEFFAIDEEVLKEYFQYDHVLERMFDFVQKFF